MSAPTPRPPWTLIEGTAWWLAFVGVTLHGIEAFWSFERGTVHRLVEAVASGQAMPLPSPVRMAATAIGLMALMVWALVRAHRARLLQRIAQASALVLALSAGMLAWGNHALSGTHLSVSLSALSAIDAEQVVAQSHARALVDGLMRPVQAGIYRDANGRFLEMERLPQQRAISLSGITPAMCGYILHWVLAQQTDLGIEAIGFGEQRVLMPDHLGLSPSTAQKKDITTAVCRGESDLRANLTLYVPAPPAT